MENNLSGSALEELQEKLIEAQTNNDTSLIKELISPLSEIDKETLLENLTQFYWWDSAEMSWNELEVKIKTDFNL